MERTQPGWSSRSRVVPITSNVARQSTWILISVENETNA